MINEIIPLKEIITAKPITPQIICLNPFFLSSGASRFLKKSTIPQIKTTKARDKAIKINGLTIS